MGVHHVGLEPLDEVVQEREQSVRVERVEQERIDVRRRDQDLVGQAPEGSEIPVVADVLALGTGDEHAVPARHVAPA